MISKIFFHNGVDKDMKTNQAVIRSSESKCSTWILLVSLHVNWKRKPVKLEDGFISSSPANSLFWGMSYSENVNLGVIFLLKKNNI